MHPDVRAILTPGRLARFWWAELQRLAVGTKRVKRMGRRVRLKFKTKDDRRAFRRMVEVRRG